MKLSSLRMAIVAACFTGCALSDDAADSRSPEPAPIAESARAHAVVGEAHARFMVRPAALPAILEREVAAERDTAPQSFLQPSEVASFVRRDAELAPTFASTLASTASVRISTRLDEGYRVARKDSGLTVGVRLADAPPTEAEIADGFVVYRDGAGAGTEVIDRPSPDGLEEFVRYQSRPEREDLTYDLDLDPGIAGLRLVENTLEMLDADGTPRLRVPPPAVVDAEGKWHWASLALEGCAYDDDPVPPWGRPTTDPGAAHCKLHLDWSRRGVTYPALVDPNTWANTGAMATARYFHVSSRISGGKVLVAGGFNASAVILSSAEIWDPGTGTWSTTGSMNDTRVFAAATATSSAATTVVVAGGIGSGCSGAPCSDVDLYSVSGGTFSASTNSMVSGRSSFTLTLLSSGTQLLAVGGVDGTSTPTNKAELYTISTDTWAATGNMSNPRYDHDATALAGSVALVATFGQDGTQALNTAEKWSGGSWSSAGTAASSIRRYKHTATLLASDHILVAGGADSTGGCITRPMVWTSPTTWASGGTMTGGNRCYHTATLLTDGKVLVAGGVDSVGGTTLNSASLYDPSANSWTALMNMATSRAAHTATLYDTTTPNKVLFAGGTNGGGATSASEYFTH